MSVPLHAHGKAVSSFRDPILGRVTSQPVSDIRARGDHLMRIAEVDKISEMGGYAGCLTCAVPSRSQLDFLEQAGIPAVHSLPTLDHVEDGDVVAIHPTGYVRTLYRVGSRHNAVFATDRCNSWCLMCSQPPRPIDDSDRISEHLRLIGLIDPRCEELGITGGEPTLLKDDLGLLIERCRDLLPATGLHVLSNGRLFYYGSFARRIAAIGHRDLMIGIPLYSAVAEEHDYIVQARGAYHQTIIGLLNLARYGIPVEIRVVVHRLTYQGLGDLAEFIYRNLPFASHVTFMGLEMMGFAVPNGDKLWVDPYDYQRELENAVRFLASTGMNVSIYNHQLCIVPRSLWRFCRRSISDWKNDYLPECTTCLVHDRCAGFFSSSLRRRWSAHIRPVHEVSSDSPYAVLERDSAQAP